MLTSVFDSEAESSTAPSPPMVAREYSRALKEDWIVLNRMKGGNKTLIEGRECREWRRKEEIVEAENLFVS